MKKKTPGYIVKSTISAPYFHMAGHPIHWESKAMELNRAANLLWDQVSADWNHFRELYAPAMEGKAVRMEISPPSVVNPYLLMAGFSLENLFKGIILIDDQSHISKGKLRGQLIASHNLVELLKHTTIKVTESEDAFLKLASEATISFGRYPIPKDMSKHNSRVTITSDNKEFYDSIFNKALDFLKEKTKETRGYKIG